MSAVGAPVLALLGPTASGKTEASIAIAEALGAEILCVDSMLVYRGMDVGTAKPSTEQRSRVPHHLLDLADPAEPFNATRFQALAREAIGTVRARGRLPLLVGGGGLYYRAVVDDLRFPGTDAADRGLLLAEGVAVGSPLLHARLASLDPGAAAKIAPSNLRRTVRALEVPAVTGRRFSSFALAWERYPADGLRAAGVLLPRPALHRRIEERVASMMPSLLEETQRLLDRGPARLLTAMQAIGYAEAAACLRGEIGAEEARVRAVRRTKALARRQLAWLRRDPRVVWFAAGEGGAREAAEPILRYLRGATAPEGALARMEA